MPYIFVGGAERTGTTLMQLLLCQGAGTNPFVREANYFRRLVEAYAEARTLAYTWDYFDSVDDLRQYHAALTRQFLERTRARFPGTVHLVLKEPTLTEQFPALAELLGDDARFVCMIRDPRDTIASLLKVGERQVSTGLGEPVPRERLKDLCARYRSFYLPIFQTPDPHFPSRIIWVKYRDLVLTPEAIISALERHLGLDLSRARQAGPMDTGRVDFSSDFERRSPWHSTLYGQPVTSERVGTYKTALTASEVAIIEEDLKDIFEVFQFDRDADAPRAGDLSRSPAA
ncbi:MAG TPA: sulfotransferase, partial [Vicinamibacterales bacterium]|nr:sulfotransferase [Vicinamibacterales bacterium]